jgi:hypothetical protein
MGDDPLAEVCGFAAQKHMTLALRQAVGTALGR